MAAVERVISTDGTRIAYRAWGEGEPLLLVHGGGTSGADWLVVLPFLRQRFRVVAMDRRGRGESDDGPAYAIEREAEDVLAVLDAIGGSLLVAHSYGALCAIRAAERTDRLRRLVLYEPPLSLTPDFLPLEALIGEERLDEALEGFLRAVGTTDEQRDAIRASPMWPNLLEILPTVPRELRAIMAWEHPAEALSVRTLFVRGGDTTGGAYLDRFDELRTAFPDSHLELIDRQQHVAHVFAAEAFARRVADFCAS